MKLIIVFNYNFFLYVSNIFLFKYFDYQSNQCRIMVVLSVVNRGGCFIILDNDNHSAALATTFKHHFFSQTPFFPNPIISNKSSHLHNTPNIPFSTLYISLKTINCIKRKNNNSNYIQFPNIGKYNKTTFYIYITLYTIKD